MGDRYEWQEDCMECGEKRAVECYDAPSCLMFIKSCEKCGWRDPRDYYEDLGNEIVLCTEEEAREKGLLVICPKCSKECGKLDVAEFKMCHSCYLK